LLIGNTVVWLHDGKLEAKTNSERRAAAVVQAHQWVLRRRRWFCNERTLHDRYTSMFIVVG
jgi:hypothetical protein